MLGWMRLKKKSTHSMETQSSGTETSSWESRFAIEKLLMLTGDQSTTLTFLNTSKFKSKLLKRIKFLLSKSTLVISQLQLNTNLNQFTMMSLSTSIFLNNPKYIQDIDMLHNINQLIKFKSIKLLNQLTRNRELLRLNNQQQNIQL